LLLIALGAVIRTTASQTPHPPPFATVNGQFISAMVADLPEEFARRPRGLIEAGVIQKTHSLGVRSDSPMLTRILRMKTEMTEHAFANADRRVSLSALQRQLKVESS
jgi:hypothetical protein